MNSTDQFEAIVSEHYEPLFRFALSLTRAEPDAQDLTQQTFFIWATKGHQLRDVAKVRTWLFTTLHRAFLEAKRRQSRFPHHELDEVSSQLPVVSPERAGGLDSSQALSALVRVDEIYQAAVALFYLEDCSYKDIAEILEVPVGTVKSRIARGIAQLKGFLADRSSAASSGKDRVSRVPIADEVSGGREKLPAPRRRFPWAARVQRDYNEQDSTATHFWELKCPVCA